MIYRFLDRYSRIIAAIMLIFALFSFFILAPFFEKPETWSGQIESLTKKETTLYGLTAACAAASAAIAAIPGDATSAMSDSVTDLTLFFVVSLSAVFLEKYLITVIGMAVFRILIPASFILAALYFITENRVCGSWSGRLIGFALVILLAVPFSTTLADQMVKTNQESLLISQSWEDTENKKEPAKGLWGTITGAFSSVADTVVKTVDDARKLLQRFVSSAAVMLVATCVMPLFAFALVFLAARFFLGLRVEEFVRNFDHYRSHKPGLPDANVEQDSTRQT